MCVYVCVCRYVYVTVSTKKRAPMCVYVCVCRYVYVTGTLQGVTAASSGTHTHAGAESRRLAWRCLARPSAGHRSYRRGAAEIPAGVSVTVYVYTCKNYVLWGTFWLNFSICTMPECSIPWLPTSTKKRARICVCVCVSRSVDL